MLTIFQLPATSVCMRTRSSNFRQRLIRYCQIRFIQSAGPLRTQTQHPTPSLTFVQSLEPVAIQAMQLAASCLQPFATSPPPPSSPSSSSHETTLLLAHSSLHFSSEFFSSFAFSVPCPSQLYNRIFVLNSSCAGAFWRHVALPRLGQLSRSCIRLQQVPHPPKKN